MRYLIVLAVSATLLSSAAAAVTLPRGDVAHGAVIFKKCAACHQAGPGAGNSVGPVLTGVIGRPAASYPGYRYSSAMKRSGIVWDEATLARFLHAPRALVRGTKMSFPGLARDQDVADVLAYLKSLAPAAASADSSRN